MDATIGIRMARATTCSMVAPKSEITIEARTAVPKFTRSHRKRRLVVSATVQNMSLSPTPARRMMSSSASSWMTSTTSSTMMAPIRRLDSSTTPAEVRSYCWK